MAANEAQITIRTVDKVTETVRRVNEAMNRVVAPVRRARREIDRLNEAVRDNAMVKGMDRMGQAAQRAGRSLAAGLTSPVAAVGALSLRTAVNFDAAMNKVEALAQAPADHLARMRDLAKDAQGNMRPFANIMTDFGNGIATLGRGDQAEAIATVFGKEAIAGATEMIKQAKSGALQAYGEQMKDVSDRAKEMADIMNRSAVGAIKSLASALEGLQLAVAESGLMDAFASLLGTVTAWVQKMSKASLITLKVITVTLALAAALGPVLMTVGWIIGAVATIAGAVYVIYQNWDAIASWFTARIDSVKQAFSDGFLTGITSILMEFNPVVLVADAINGLIAYLFGVDMLGLGKEFIRGLWDGIKEGFAGLTSWLAEALRGLTAWMPDWVKDKRSIAMPEGGPLLPINTPPVGGAVRKATVVASIVASAVAPSIIPAVAKASNTSRVTRPSASPLRPIPSGFERLRQ